MNAAEIKAIPFRQTADRILTLGELCDLVAGRAALIIELKSHFDNDRRLIERTVAVLQNYAGPVAVMSERGPGAGPLMLTNANSVPPGSNPRISAAGGQTMMSASPNGLPFER